MPIDSKSTIESFLPDRVSLRRRQPGDEGDPKALYTHRWSAVISRTVCTLKEKTVAPLQSWTVRSFIVDGSHPYREERGP